MVADPLAMTDLPASWRMPTGKQMEKMAAALDSKAPLTPAMAPDVDLPAEYWQALLDDASADIRSSGSSIAALRLSEPDLALEWRRAQRAALGGALDAGYHVTAFTRSGHYLLEVSA